MNTQLLPLTQADRLILSHLLRGSATAQQIIATANGRYPSQVAPATVYRRCHRLLDHDAIEMDNDKAKQYGRERYFKITSVGQTLLISDLAVQRDMLQTMSNSVSDIRKRGIKI